MTKRENVYVYQILDLLFQNAEKLEELIAEVKEFETWEGLTSQIILLNAEEQIASALYFCETYEAALFAQKRMKKLVETYNELIGYTHEFIFSVVNSTEVNWRFIEDDMSIHDIRDNIEAPVK